jgi:phosphoserine phosphatase RsbU/P
MLKGILTFFTRSFRMKLLLFILIVVILTTISLFVFLMNNFNSITEFSLEQNTIGMEHTVEDYLSKITREMATSTWLQIKAAEDNLSILGKTAQRIVDNYEVLSANPEIFNLELFQTELTEKNGGLSGPAADHVDALIPVPIADDPRAVEVLSTSALLNLSIEAVYEANQNNVFLYFVGDTESPVTRAYPNIHLIDVLGEGIELVFWKDYFTPNVAGWNQWYTNPELQERIPSPITVESPYEDAAGQGMMVTMFYPLWDAETNSFAGAVGADITLNNIVENILSIQIARTGFAFLMNGKGEIIAMPEAGHAFFELELVETKLGELSYYTGSLTASENPAVQAMAAEILEQSDGVYYLNMDPTGTENNEQIVTFASLPPISDIEYEEDRWRVAIVVPQVEIFETLYQTDAAVTQEKSRMTGLSLALVVGSILIAAVISTRFSGAITRDLQTLGAAAEQVSAKNYDLDMDLKSQDELGQLGQAFEVMTQEIQDYTQNLEEKVAVRTADLQDANEKITELNAQLKDENVRLSAELDVARKLQLMVLPPESETDAIEEFDIATYMEPADEVGGDYYDALKMDDTIFLTIGDVTGHGLPAGVIMLMAQTSFLTLSQSGEQDMKRMLSLLNQVIYRNIIRINDNKNMTLAVLRYHDQEFSVVGQHESILICRTDGTIEDIDTLDLGLPLGLVDDIDSFVNIKQFTLNPDDVMVLYSDGITEAANEHDEQFTLPKLTATLEKYHDLGAKEIRDKIIAEVYAFIGDTQIYDDISMMVIKQK